RRRPAIRGGRGPARGAPTRPTRPRRPSGAGRPRPPARRRGAAAARSRGRRRPDGRARSPTAPRTRPTPRARSPAAAPTTSPPDDTRVAPARRPAVHRPRRTLDGVQFERAGRVPYDVAWQRQRDLHAARVADEIDDTVLLLEHDPVYTAGKRTEPW